MISTATNMIERAIVASTGALASLTQPKVVPASVRECATVKAVMAPTRRFDVAHQQQQREHEHQVVEAEQDVLDAEDEIGAGDFGPGLRCRG